MSRKIDLNRNEIQSPRIVIFILLNSEIPDVARSRGMVMKIPTVIESGIKRRVAFSNRQTNLPSIISGLV